MTVETKAAGLTDVQRALLARRLRDAAVSDEETITIRPRATGTRVRISVDQYRIWLHHSMHPELPLYNEPVSVFHRGPLDPGLLQRALEFYAGRHEAWRTSFQMVGDEVLQVVAESVTVSVTFQDLSVLEPERRQAEDERIARDNAVAPFDLGRGPLFRAVLNRMSAGEDRLHLVVHHLVFDGTAIRNSFVPELAVIYAALAEEREPELKPVALQYPDFAVWREQQVASPAMEPALEFWKEKLAGDLPLLRLPMDRPRPAVSSQRGAMRSFTLGAELTAQLRGVCRQHRATLYMLLLASLEALLFRYSGQEDVVVGTAANGRSRPELQGMMGYMLDTFPVRVKAGAGQSFLELLAAVRAELFGAMGAAEVPFDKILQVSGARRDPSYHPIFQTFFSFPPPVAEAAGAWDLQPKLVDTGTAKFDLYLEAEERGDELAACILYSTDLFEESTIERLVGHWTTMLEGIAREPATTLGALPLLTEAERGLMLGEWNENRMEVAASTMQALFAEQVLKTPANVAVEFGKTRLSYAELDERAERFAFLLQEAGAARGTLVALCIDRSENLLVALLGILKTGATYLPLDPGTPLARITVCLEDAEPAVLLTQRRLLQELPATGAKTICLEDLLVEAAKLPDGTRVAAGLAGPDDSAYIIHTSGSTGRPKAVELGQQAVMNLLLSFQRELGLTSDDVLVAVTTVSFDIAVLELFLPVITGARVVIASRTTALDPFELSDLLEASGGTVIQATPATWRALIASEWTGKPRLRVLCGGEALSRDLAEKLLALGLELWNVYGPTETCIWSTLSRVQTGTGGVPIGRPIANTTTYILDAREQPVPVGVAGELYLGGMGLAKGYRGQEGLTADKFVRPAVAGGERLYRTGDYALYRADGTIECQGRADNQVKVRGYRIELEEVELNLSAYSEVSAAAARVWKDAAVGNRLTGYVVPKPGRVFDAREMRRFLQARIPEYMIPTQFVVLDAMPLTSNGKMDRKALPETAEVAALQSEVKVEEEMTEDEEALAAIWCEVLGVKKVGLGDNFFALGGHSLLLVVLFAKINRRFATNLPLTTIFDAQTLRALAGLLREKVRISSLVRVQTLGSKTPLFMAHSYLLYHALSGVLGKDQPFYGLRELETDGDLSIEARAQLYVSDMRSVQPQGPYCVAGWCAAGPLAVEIARQLLLQGEKIKALVLFDAWLPGYLEEAERVERGRSYLWLLRSKWAVYEAKMKGLSLGGQMQYVAKVARRIGKARRDKFYIENWATMHRLSARLRLPVPQFMHNTTLQTVVAMRQFRAERLPLKITLIRASEAKQIASASDGCGWEQVAADGVTTVLAPGDHESMFRGKNLQTTGALVQAALDEVESVGCAEDGIRQASLSEAVPMRTAHV